MVAAIYCFGEILIIRNDYKVKAFQQQAVLTDEAHSNKE
jgi:hypothetical protein